MRNILEAFFGMVSIIFDRMNVILPFFSAPCFMLDAGSSLVFAVKRRGKPVCLPFMIVFLFSGKHADSPLHIIDEKKQIKFSFANAGTSCTLASKKNLYQQIGFVIHNS
jgi:hypothetical protein